jgi:hypothetical protein
MTWGLVSSSILLSQLASDGTGSDNQCRIDGTMGRLKRDTPPTMNVQSSQPTISLKGG